jgi:hypothetical protein
MKKANVQITVESNLQIGYYKRKPPRYKNMGNQE